ncbi:MAG TPA: hypothetical protein PLC54_01140 [Spirochaetales bacterium]|nr:hypothetical protein [Spirochaetales bacterium]
MSEKQPQEPESALPTGEPIAINQFSSARMGLVPGSSVLKVDRYAVACIPFRMSLSGAVLLTSFSPQELTLFMRYTNTIAGLSIAFQRADAAQTHKIFARCTIKSIAPMRGRESVGLISIAWKPCPPDLTTTLEEYLLMLERLKVEYDDYKGKLIKLDPANAALLGYNNYAAIIHGREQVKVAAFCLASDRLDFLVPKDGPELVPKAMASVKLFFRSFQFVVSGILSDVQKLPNGAQKAILSLNFCPELVDILERYRFHEQFSSQKTSIA